MDPNWQAYHHHSVLGRAPPCDGPRTPPISNYIPDWERCGARNCDTHHYSDNPGGYGAPVAGMDEPLHLHESHCSRCSRSFNTVSLHFLPCNHTLCRDCLNTVALAVHNTIRENKEEIDNNLANAFLRSKISTHTEDPEIAAQMAREEAEIFASVLDLAGFTCCGQPTRLGRFLYCMDARIAKLFWCDHDYLDTQPERRNFCGWPDCRAFVPSKCGFVDRAGYRPAMLHCPSCRGNGMLVAWDNLSPRTHQGAGNVWMPVGEPFPRYYSAVRV